MPGENGSDAGPHDAVEQSENGSDAAHSNGNGHHPLTLREVLVGFSMLGMGGVMRYEQRREADLGVWPAGEPEPPWIYWIERYRRAPEGQRQSVLEQAHAYLERWKRRPPELTEATYETLDELKQRIVSDGEGWTADEVALSFRCTPTLVRRAREEFDRCTETGKVEGSLEHARTLIATGHSLRQAAMLTGIPRATLSTRLKR